MERVGAYRASNYGADTISNGDAAGTGFVAVDKTNRQILLVLRGSVAVKNFIADILYFQQPCGAEMGFPGAKCEQGFLEFLEGL